jgi:hypothetical protein
MSNGAVIEFAAEEAVMPEKLFELLAELAAETWHKAAVRWQELNRAPVQFVSAASPETSSFKRKLRRLYAPAEVPMWGRGSGLIEST